MTENVRRQARLADERSTAATGAWPSPTHHGVGLPGVRQRDNGPFPRTLEHPFMQGKVRGVRDPHPLGAGMDTSCSRTGPPEMDTSGEVSRADQPIGTPTSSSSWR